MHIIYDPMTICRSFDVLSLRLGKSLGRGWAVMVLEAVREWRLRADAYVSIGTILLGIPDQAQKLDSGTRSSIVVMSTFYV